MHHFTKHSHTRLLALCLSAGLIMGSLSGCSNQGQGNGTIDTIVESASTSSTDVTDITAFPMPEGPEESTIYVEPVDGISDDFYRGMDASAVLALENSGVKYYNFDGEEQDVFMTLAQAGVNYIRLRVWNDPYDENGNGYGGGNNDVATANCPGSACYAVWHESLHRFSLFRFLGGSEEAIRSQGMGRHEY